MTAHSPPLMILASRSYGKTRSVPWSLPYTVQVIPSHGIHNKAARPPSHKFYELTELQVRRKEEVERRGPISRPPDRLLELKVEPQPEFYLPRIRVWQSAVDDPP